MKEIRFNLFNKNNKSKMGFFDFMKKKEEKKPEKKEAPKEKSQQP